MTTNKDILQLKTDLEKVDLSSCENWPTPDTRFDVLYDIAKKKSEIKRLSDIINSTLKIPNEINDYYEAINNVNIKFANKDESGRPKTFKVGDKELYDIPRNEIDNPLSDYNIEIKEIKEQYHSTLEQFAKNQKEFQKFLLKENTDIKLPCIKKGVLPKDISQDFLERLMPLIE